MIKLTRFYKGEDRTLGRLTYEGASYYTIEKPWKDNTPFESCIPLGEYDLVRHNSPKFGANTWMLTGVDNRSYILIHPANTERDVVGCIGLGSGIHAKLTGVSQSGKAVQAFKAQTSGMATEKIVITEGLLT